MRQALLQTAVLPPVSLSGSLNNPLAQAWQPLYLGQVAPGRFVGMVRLNGVHDTAALRDVAAAVAGVHWVDKPARLNTLFHQTRNQAAWLKLVSFALAWLALMAMLGRRRGSQVLAVPLASAVLTVAVLGWLGQPVSLFAMFGLLLVSAIGVDYALYIATAKHDGHERLIGMLLAAATTLISFVLLGFSATPAVAGFGLAVGHATGRPDGFLWIALVLLAVGGAADMVSAVFRSTILQEAASDELRGRLQGVFTVVVAGGPRIADAVHGAAAAVVGTTVAAAGGGVLVVVGVVVSVLVVPAFVRYRVARR